MNNVTIDPAVITLGHDLKAGYTSTGARERDEKRARSGRLHRKEQKRAARKHLAELRETRWR